MLEECEKLAATGDIHTFTMLHVYNVASRLFTAKALLEIAEAINNFNHLSVHQE